MHTGKEALEILSSPYALEEVGPIFIFEIPQEMEMEEVGMEMEEVEKVLLQLPSVTCGVIPGNTEKNSENLDLKESLDIVLSSSLDLSSSAEPDIEGSLKKLDQAVRQNPIASVALVQLLRLGRDLKMEDRLVAESLAYSTLQSGDEFKSWLSSYREKKPRKQNEFSEGSEPVVLVKRSGNLLELALNRPEKHNAYSAEMRDQLAEAFRTALVDETITDIQVSAIGPSFSAGGDLDEFGTTPNPATAHLVRSMRNVGWLMHSLKDRINVKLHGACVGAGIELPAFAEKVSAHPNAVFQLPEISLGLVPGAGGTASIPQRIGRHRTAWMALTGDTISTKTALDWGLIDGVSE